MNWKKLLESTSASVNDALQLHNAYLATENRILRQQINGRVLFTDSDRRVLAEMGAKLGKKTLAETATVATPETSLAWHRTQDMAKVVDWSTARARQIRDGPRQCRQRFNLLFKDDLRRAA